MADPLFSIREQVVVVSGGTRGIGLAIAEGFAQRGARVVLTGRIAAAAEASAGQLAGDAEFAPVGLACDVTRTGDIERLAAGVLDRFGHVDTLVNVAGVNRRKPALEVSEDDYNFILDTNLKGAFLLSRELGKAMTARGRGSQINIASLNTDRPLKNVLPYAMSKAAMAHMTRGLAVEWGPAGVRVNAIAPGFILTDLTRKLWSDPTMEAWGRANTPQQRLGTPEDMVGAAIFLASPAAAFITGQILYVDGGFTAGWSWPIPPSGGQ
ncbi:MAG: glucose 1-dehydrogenase [Planctomycetaceae bacterium]|nr:glucose 1-dehydrogenase [Planctomycetaceae bacterium]